MSRMPVSANPRSRNSRAAARRIASRWRSRRRARAVRGPLGKRAFDFRTTVHIMVRRAAFDNALAPGKAGADRMDLLFARWQMGLSLAFHIVFAVIGMALPLMMVAAEAAWLRTGEAGYLDLARRWSRGTAILFAVGAVSGTVLSFELGLLWPAFMEFAGPLIGMPFSLEGFAFFLEAIFLGLYLYGWERLNPRTHLAAGVFVCLGGAFWGAFVVLGNAW